MIDTRCITTMIRHAHSKSTTSPTNATRWRSLTSSSSILCLNVALSVCDEDVLLAHAHRTHKNTQTLVLTDYFHASLLSHPFSTCMKHLKASPSGGIFGGETAAGGSSPKVTVKHWHLKKSFWQSTRWGCCNPPRPLFRNILGNHIDIQPLVLVVPWIQETPLSCGSDPPRSTWNREAFFGWQHAWRDTLPGSGFHQRKGDRWSKWYKGTSGECQCISWVLSKSPKTTQRVCLTYPIQIHIQ